MKKQHVCYTIGNLLVKEPLALHEKNSLSTLYLLSGDTWLPLSSLMLDVLYAFVPHTKPRIERVYNKEDVLNYVDERITTLNSFKSILKIVHEPHERLKIERTYDYFYSQSYMTFFDTIWELFRLLNLLGTTAVEPFFTLLVRGSVDLKAIAERHAKKQKIALSQGETTSESQRALLEQRGAAIQGLCDKHRELIDLLANPVFCRYLVLNGDHYPVFYRLFLGLTRPELQLNAYEALYKHREDSYNAHAVAHLNENEHYSRVCKAPSLEEINALIGREGVAIVNETVLFNEGVGIYGTTGRLAYIKEGGAVLVDTLQELHAVMERRMEERAERVEAVVNEVVQRFCLNLEGMETDWVGRVEDGVRMLYAVLNALYPFTEGLSTLFAPLIMNVALEVKGERSWPRTESANVLFSYVRERVREKRVEEGQLRRIEERIKRYCEYLCGELEAGSVETRLFSRSVVLYVFSRETATEYLRRYAEAVKGKER